MALAIGFSPPGGEKANSWAWRLPSPWNLPERGRQRRQTLQPHALFATLPVFQACLMVEGAKAPLRGYARDSPGRPRQRVFQSTLGKNAARAAVTASINLSFTKAAQTRQSGAWRPNA